MMAMWKPICQQTIGNINDYWSVFMDLYGGLEEQAEVRDGEIQQSRCQRILNIVLAKALTTSIYLQTSSSLCMAPDDVQLFMDRLQTEREQLESEKEGETGKGISKGSGSSGSDTLRGLPTTPASLRSSRSLKSQANLARINSLKDSVKEAVARHSNEVGSYRKLPRMFASIFLAKNPWFTVTHYSMYTPASLSMMLLMTEITGDMAIAALFYRADGAKAKGGGTNCSGDDVGAALGKMLAIGIAASLFAVVPVSVLSKLRERDFKVFHDEDSNAWRRQLRKWCCQDILVWISGVSYILFCSFFVSVFIANVSTKDGLLWMFSTALAIGQSALLAPLLISSVLTPCAFMAARRNQLKQRVTRSMTFDPGIEDPAYMQNRQSRSSSSFDSMLPDPESCFPLDLCPRSDTTEHEPQLSPQFDCQLAEACTSGCAPHEGPLPLVSPLALTPLSGKLDECMWSRIPGVVDSGSGITLVGISASRIMDATQQPPTPSLATSLGGKLESTPSESTRSSAVGDANDEPVEDYYASWAAIMVEDSMKKVLRRYASKKQLGFQDSILI
jgi:hypothetical protein